MQLYDRHSITAKGVDETVNWNMKDPLFLVFKVVLATRPQIGGFLSWSQCEFRLVSLAEQQVFHVEDITLLDENVEITELP